ncbi:MAG: HigA family addiction module antitoxin [Burkholderiaceae bacterium]|jgi:addiction module HigA family antidote
MLTTTKHQMRNPAHPGEIIREWLPHDMTVTQAAEALGCSRVTLSRLLNGSAGVSAEMAVRLAHWLGTREELWLDLQNQYDLAQISRPKLIKAIKPLGRVTTTSGRGRKAGP